MGSKVKSTRQSITNSILPMSIIAIVNGSLYFFIAIDGGGNITKIFEISGEAANHMIYAVSVGASFVYTMFTYKTLESLSLKINSASKVFFALLAPFSAVAFLTAGKEGAELLKFTPTIALSLGITLFIFRIINCVDASVKFPQRLLGTKQAWNQAWQKNDYAEITRLIVIWIASLGYVACTTDAIYAAVQIIGGWLGANPDVLHPVSSLSALAGALGTLPLNVYWSHRGLRQLTFGGKMNSEGINPDPTDGYTYLGLLLVIPVILGILGAATASSGAMFGQLGTFSQFVRVITSILYAIFAGTPGMATILRSSGQRLQYIFNHSFENEISKPLLPDQENIIVSDEDNKPISEIKKLSSSRFFNFFRTATKNDEYVDIDSPKRINKHLCVII
ncbi:MAG TPA: hypothetical protein VJN02_09010 [Gammaproteobacteria bacterium]|nr:hypothetical protein [Gammaproteobacteria bacterium]